MPTSYPHNDQEHSASRFSERCSYRFSRPVQLSAWLIAEALVSRVSAAGPLLCSGNSGHLRARFEAARVESIRGIFKSPVV